MNHIIFAGLPEHIKNFSLCNLKNQNPKIKDIGRVMNNACRLVGCEQNELMSKSRRSEIITARRLFCHYLRNYTNMTFSSIGRCLGLDHSTALYHEKTMAGYLEFNDEYSVKLHKKYTEMNSDLLEL